MSNQQESPKISTDLKIEDKGSSSVSAATQPIAGGPRRKNDREQREQIAKLEKNISSLRDDLKEKVEEIEKITRDNSKANEKIRKMAEELASNKSDRLALDNSHKNLKESAEDSEKKIKELERKVEELKNTNDDFLNKKRQLELEIQKLKETIEEKSINETMNVTNNELTVSKNNWMTKDQPLIGIIGSAIFVVGFIEIVRYLTKSVWSVFAKNRNQEEKRT